ncbi:MAG: hypothetical protein AAF202_10960, partial [Pseudomonadota bacterium]
VISSQQPVKTLISESTLEVSDVENSVDLRTLTTLKKVNEPLKDKSFTYEIKNVFFLPQIESLSLQRKFYEQELSVRQNVLPREDDFTTSSEIQGVAYHNLKTQTVTLVPPETIQKAGDCRGLDNCEIQAELISYDVVFLMADDTTQTHNVEWYISRDVPFFAGLFKQCATTLVPIESLRVLVKQCTEVIDFSQTTPQEL